MPRTKYVKITKGELEGEVLASSLAVYERNGWTAVDDGSSESTSDAPTGDPSQGDQVGPTVEEPRKTGRTETKE